MDGIANTQRAVWTFLFYALVGPFIGALAIVVLMPIATAFELLPEIQSNAPAGMLPLLGRTAVYAYVWAALPAVLAALGLVPFVIRDGTFGWIHAAIAGVLAFAVAAVLFVLPVPELIAYLAFLAGLVSLVCRSILIRAGVLTVG